MSVIIENPLHFEEESVVFDTKEINRENAQISVRSRVVNEQNETVNAVVRHTLLWQNTVAWQNITSAVIKAGECFSSELLGDVANPHLWFAETPNLYTLRSQIELNGEIVSEREAQVGIRTFRFDADRGFFINGNHTVLKGVCVHHDAGCLGAAVRKEVWRRRLERLKQMGCNAIRMSHNPHMPALFELCDEMGFFAIDEAFDEWEGCKNKWSTGHNVYPPKHQGYFKDFPQWGGTDLRALVRRDRNHPSVILWSIGNEVDYPNDPYCHPLLSSATGNNDANKPAAEREYSPAKPNMERLVPIMRHLAKIVREEDSRPVTAALAFPEISSHIGCAELLDVVGYNYKEGLYQESHERFPQKPFIGSENSHDYAAWKAVEENEFIAGQFLWTGIDFLGETKGWPSHGSNAGFLTTAGYPKGEYWHRRALWLQKPVATLVTARSGSDTFERRWQYAKGERVTVRCCTREAQAEFFCNKKSLGIQKRSDETGAIEWETDFGTGTLAVLAGGLEDTLCTTVSPVSLQIKQWKSDKKDGNVLQIEVSLLDYDGRETSGSEMLSVSATGAACLLGLENGEQTDNTEYSASYRRTYNGRLLVYLLATAPNGTAHLTISGDAVGCHTASFEIE
ncbi:MAG: glycoside hydrolase family 2 protein [Clostridia bacterium]|nr:glycoside hydrolase family 2 protein [Clostridia bacterium]NLS86318.1 glycoside hydrolase family 2 protein [Oscillospiraceae bacterium]